MPARTLERRPPPLAIIAGVALLAAVLGFVLLRSGADEPARGGPGRGDARAQATARVSDPEADDDEPRSEDDPDPAPRPTAARAGGDAPAADGGADLDEDEADARSALAAVRRARADLSKDGTEALLAAMRSDDAVVVAEAGKALVLRNATGAIPALAKIDLRKAGGGGLTVIETLGKLAAGAPDGDAQRSAAVDRLLEMLAHEKQHEGPETPGNLLQIYEALGDTRDARAAAALEGELGDPAVARAPKVVVVEALAKIAAPSSRTALLRARGTELATKLTDAFEAEVQSDLVHAIDAALSRL